MNSTGATLVRDAVVAGMFYPADPVQLTAAVDDAFEQAETAGAPVISAPCAVISPHAGYRFSGWLAAAALGASGNARPDSIVVLSPSHRHAFDGIALPSAAAYRMPGFETGIDQEVGAALVAGGLAHVEDAAHDYEHGIETQLPFLHRLHPGVRVVPLVIGRASTEHVARVVDFVASFRKTAPLFVLSSDLSHFLTLEEAQKHDAAAARLIETGQSGKMSPAHACGMRGIAGYLASDHAQGTRVQRLAMANSHAASGDAGRTVGYGAWAFYDTDRHILAPAHRKALLKVARQALASRITKGKMPEIAVSSFATPLRTYAPAFVTLKKGDRLRGCIGSLAAHRPLVQDVVENAVKAGCDDPRFPPLADNELDEITIKIAVLSPSRPMLFTDQGDLEAQLSPGRDGVILTDGRHRGTFLPMVWDSLPSPGDFMSALKRKAGLPEDHWSDSLRIERFRTEDFAERI